MAARKKESPVLLRRRDSVTGKETRYENTDVKEQAQPTKKTRSRERRRSFLGSLPSFDGHNSLARVFGRKWMKLLRRGSRRRNTDLNTETPSLESKKSAACTSSAPALSVKSASAPVSPVPSTATTYSIEEELPKTDACTMTSEEANKYINVTANVSPSLSMNQHIGTPSEDKQLMNVLYDTVNAKVLSVVMVQPTQNSFTSQVDWDKVGDAVSAASQMASPVQERAAGCGSTESPEDAQSEPDYDYNEHNFVIEEKDLETLLAAKMLQQILRDMYIEPELLAELSEEQKQVLFCKMREEQVRLWKEREEILEREERKKPKKPPKPGIKKVDFLLGNDGCPWVWVMGEHKNDRSIEEILEEEAQLNAQKIAEKEAEELRKKEEEELKRKMKEEQERIEKEKREREIEIKRKAEEAALYQSLKEARLAAQKLEEEKKQKEEEERRKLEELKKKETVQLRRLTESQNKMREKRASEIYMSFREARKKFEKTAEETSKKVEAEWQEQEKKAKEAEAEIRAIARRAREEHRRSSLYTTANVIGALSSNFKQAPPLPEKSGQANNNQAPVRNRPARPANRDAVADWFRRDERPKGTGIDPKTRKPYEWFHGLITRQKAEDLLENKKVGTFLVRVSERVWGYTISYRAADRCKHFLIDTTNDGQYQFFGSNQLVHSKLEDVIEFHKTKPISGAGQEILQFPCGQSSKTPDYEELFDKQNVSLL